MSKTLSEPDVTHDLHIDFHAPGHGEIKYQVYAGDRVRLDLGTRVTLFLTVDAMDSLARQLDLARAEIARERAYVDPLKEVWDAAVAF